jgi:hypothetical protein
MSIVERPTAPPVMTKTPGGHVVVRNLTTATSLEALTGEQFAGGFGVGPPRWLMLLVFLGYTVLAGLVGTAAAHRRDIT